MELKLRVNGEMIARLEAIRVAMQRDCGVVVDVEAVAYRALSMGIDDLERIFEIKRPPHAARHECAGDAYEKHDQLSGRLAF